MFAPKKVCLLFTVRSDNAWYLWTFGLVQTGVRQILPSNTCLQWPTSQTHRWRVTETRMMNSLRSSGDLNRTPESLTMTSLSGNRVYCISLWWTDIAHSLHSEKTHTSACSRYSPVATSLSSNEVKGLIVFRQLIVFPAADSEGKPCF